MATTFPRSLSQVKDDLPRLIQRYVLDCLAEHPDWRWRDRVLNPLNTVMLFVTQVLHGNTAMTHLRHLSGMNFTPTAYCRARMRLPLELLQQLSQRITHRLLTECDDVSRWRGGTFYFICVANAIRVVWRNRGGGLLPFARGITTTFPLRRAF